MTKKILIDASLPEETRLAIAQGRHIDVFETETQRQIKNNIYLAQVTRVESSLQAAFVEYGGNRHGFLAFSEIHPDYFQIPVGDRPADDSTAAAPEPVADIPETAAPPYDPQDLLNEDQDDRFSYPISEDEPGQHNGAADEDMASKDAPPAEEMPEKMPEKMHEKYNIQEVVKRRQVLLVQVTKEERGNKGAALTTYLSLAGRYCVLMPNTDRSGGVSRKIASNEMRSKLRDIASGLAIPDGMSLILRTAGAQQPQNEIERDLEYLTRLWEKIRARTLESTAPALIYEEGNLIHRALRDMLKKDISEIRIQGADAHQQAKNFLQMLMPAALDILFEHKEADPIFSHCGIEDALDDMNNPVVQLKSGGYIVINPTEALVAIDVNSGRATREHNLEDTALKTNMEAADEIARQARLRDLAGLIVIDFIDMDNSRNVRDVEKRMRDAVRRDRARVQLGRISQNFGLFEMSRQRLRPELSSGRTETCPQCEGSGQTPTAQTIALRALRSAIAQAAQAGAASETTLRLNWPVVLYILNNKRDELSRLEKEHGIKLLIEAGGTDNPDKPWMIETKKAPSTARSSVNGSAGSDAINVETIYAQMPEAQTTAADKQRAEPQEARRRKPRRRSRHNRPKAQKNYQSQKSQHHQKPPPKPEGKNHLYGSV